MNSITEFMCFVRKISLFMKNDVRECYPIKLLSTGKRGLGGGAGDFIYFFKSSPSWSGKEESFHL